METFQRPRKLRDINQYKVQAAFLKKLLPQLWPLPWTNQHKEVFWRLTLDALPNSARLHNAVPCICGAPTPDRMHHFWSCPVAEGMIAAPSDHLLSRGLLSSPLLPLHVLLACTAAILTAACGALAGGLLSHHLRPMSY